MNAGEQIRRDTIVEERTGVLNLARRSREGTAAQVRVGKLTEDVAGQIDRAVFAFAEMVAIGLHIEGETDACVRRRLRDAVKAMTTAPEALPASVGGEVAR